MPSSSERVYYDNRRGLRVTGRFISTRSKDEALGPIESVQIGRELLLIALICASALLASAWRFDDLLYAREQLLLAGAAALALTLGASFAPLRLGRYAHEKTFLWGPVWKVHAVRRAILRAKRSETARDHTMLIAENPAE